jgi:hypothetical protein
MKQATLRTISLALLLPGPLAAQDLPTTGTIDTRLGKPS